MEKLIKHLKELKISLIDIDVTDYLVTSIKDSDFTTFPNKEFSFSYDQGAIFYEGHGLWGSDNKPRVLNIEFFHDLSYFNGVEQIKTECSFEFEKVEDEIDVQFSNQINNL